MAVLEANRLDTGELKNRVDLLDLIGRDSQLKRVATTRGGEWAGPCPFCGGKDRLHVQPETGLWRCRQCSPGERWQDAIAYVQRRDGLSFRDACAALGGQPSPTSTATRTPARAMPQLPPIDDTPPPDAWQKAARAYCTWAAQQLWSPAGERAIAYLRECRGLTDATIRRFGLGYQPADDWRAPGRWGLTDGKKVWLSAGIVIPCLADGAIWYVKTRRPEPGDELTGYIGKCEPRGKYPQVRGSKPALFGADGLAGREVVVLAEGEFDAILLAQECGDLAGVATLGSASAALAGRWLWALRQATRVLAAYDLDAAGGKGLAKVAAISGRVRTARPVGGNDLTDMHRAGGNLRAWLTFNLAKHAPATSTASAEPVGNLSETAPQVSDAPLASEASDQDAPAPALPSEPGELGETPAISEAEPAPVDELADPDAAALLAWGECMGWPALPFKPGHKIVEGDAAWRAFARMERGEKLELALAAARAICEAEVTA